MRETISAECAICGDPVQKPYRKACSAKHSKEYRAISNRERCRRRWAATSEEERKRCRENGRRWREENSEKEKERCRKKGLIRYALNPERGRQNSRSRRQRDPDKVKECANRWLKANREKAREGSRRWAQANPENNREKYLRWRKANPDYEKERIKTDVQFKLIKRIRSRLRTAMRKNYKSGSAIKDLGCSISELKIHLEARFDANMTWENWGPYWHIDHILPLASFDLTDRDQFLRAAHWSNLQPLEKIANMRKGKRMPVSNQDMALAA
jgi:hypothetical protein